jgi:hypothetical protein
VVGWASIQKCEWLDKACALMLIDVALSWLVVCMVLLMSSAAVKLISYPMHPRLLLAHSCPAGCSVLIERKDPTNRTRAILNLAEVKLFNDAGTPIPRDKLKASMSSTISTYDGPVDMCVDGIVPKPGKSWNFCQTAETGDANPWLRVTYPCATGLSRVEVYNRVDQRHERILDFQLRFLGPGNSTAGGPFPFDAVPTGKDVYKIQPGDTEPALLLNCTQLTPWKCKALLLFTVLLEPHRCAHVGYQPAAQL